MRRAHGAGTYTLPRLTTSLFFMRAERATSILPSLTVQDWLAQASLRLRAISQTPRLDAQVLLAHVLDTSRTWVLAHPEFALGGEQQRQLEAALQRLEQGEPLPYLLGHWEFYGLDFLLTPATLIPRPETELLVEQALHWLEAHPEKRLAIDVGSGSGCIAVTLAVKVPTLQVIAGDLSFEALQVTRRNALRHGVAERVHCLQADLLSACGAAFDLICANPPYIPSETLRQLPIYGREPTLALDGGAEGLEHIRRLLQQAEHCLAEEGLLLLEIEATQGQAVRALAEQTFPRCQMSILPDLAGRDRLLYLQRQGG
ncbi:MAG: peptide chain release factor N(5)-glutamine methyltransferase [Candidatus Methanomethyliaceae archaeon]